ncbi:MAG: hypothetical protein LBQ54_07230 [Planctomycetaceae bacterium]|jgi:hypothetical protein|nr:hypothetical protein [Planctomycetaceae bacterium]
MKNYNLKWILLVVGALMTFVGSEKSFGQLQMTLGTGAGVGESKVTPADVPASGGVQANAPQNTTASPPETPPMGIPLQLGTPVQVPGYPPGAMVIPVTVPEMVTVNPPPMNLIINRPAQLVIPPYSPYPVNPYAIPPMMYPPQITPPPQPIPTRMIMPDGSVVSIKHYVPGKFWRNTIRAVTP